MMGLPSTLVALISNSVFQALVLIPLGLVALDLASGVAASVVQGTFDLKRLPDFLSRDILKYAGGVFLVLLSWFFFSSSVATTLTAALGMSALSLSVVSSIWSNLHEVFAKNPVALALVDAAASQVGLSDPGVAKSIPDPVGPGVPVILGPSAVLPPASLDSWATNPNIPEVKSAPPAP